MKMIFSVGRCLKRKTMLEWVRQYIIKNFAACKILCNLQELYTAFKEKHPNINIGFSNFLCLEAQMVCCGCLKNDSLCLRLYCSSKCCVASRCNGLELDIQRPDQEDRLRSWEQQIHHASVWILSWHCNSERISWSGTQITWRWCES